MLEASAIFSLMAEAYYIAGKTIEEKFESGKILLPSLSDSSKYWKNQAETIVRDTHSSYHEEITKLQTEGKYQEAIDLIKGTIELDPASADLRVELGICYFYLGNLEDSSKSYKEALTIDHNNVQAFLNLGINYYHQGENLKALEHLQNALSTDKQNSLVLKMIGKAYSKMEKFENAKEYFEKSLQINPLDWDCWNSLGYVFKIGLLELDEAKRCYEESLKINPDSLRSQTNLAEIAILQNDYGKAMQKIENTLTTHEDIEIGLLMRIMSVCIAYLDPETITSIALSDLLSYYKTMDARKIDWNLRVLSKKISEECPDPDIRILLETVISLVNIDTIESKEKAISEIEQQSFKIQELYISRFDY